MQADSAFALLYKNDEHPMSTLSQRIDAGCDALRIGQSDLADLVGMTNRQVLYQIKSGERPGRKWLPLIAKQLSCSVEWLVNGTGEAPSWAGVQAATHVRSLGEAYMSAVVPDDQTTLILARIDALQRLIEQRLPAPMPAHDETIRAGLAIPDPPTRTADEESDTRQVLPK
jgi:hypothetical protein